jgi:hypothetical protein
LTKKRGPKKKKLEERKHRANLSVDYSLYVIAKEFGSMSDFFCRAGKHYVESGEFERIINERKKQRSLAKTSS